MNRGVLLILFLVVTDGQTAPLEDQTALSEESQTTGFEECDNIDMLNDEKCQPWNQLSDKYIEEKYPGILMEEHGLKTAEQEFAAIRKEFLGDGVKIGDESHDGDTCCPTSFTYHKNTSMTNLHGVRRPIIHIPPHYQFIPHGSCAGTGKCHGKCVVEPLPMSLLTFDYSTGQPVFETFIVPGYCSCKNVRYSSPWSFGSLIG